MAHPQREGRRKEWRERRLEKQREYETFPASEGANGTMHIKVIF